MRILPRFRVCSMYGTVLPKELHVEPRKMELVPPKFRQSTSHTWQGEHQDVVLGTPRLDLSPEPHFTICNFSDFCDFPP